MGKVRHGHTLRMKDSLCTQVLRGRLARWCSDAQRRRACALAGRPGRMGLRWCTRKAACPGASDLQLPPPGEERQGGEGDVIRSPEELSIPELSKSTPSSYRNQILISRARE